MDVSRERLAWLIRLRWYAMIGVFGATIVGLLGWVPGLNWRVTFMGAVLGLSFNAYLVVKLRSGMAPGGALSLLWQAVLDMVILTAVLGACGGTDTPFMGFYFFHVALIGVLGGRWGVFIAVVMVGMCVGVLSFINVVPSLQYGEWDPVSPLDLLMDGAGFVSALGLIAYIVHHAMRELRERERALARARDRIRVEDELLSNTLDELGAGLELMGEGEKVIWRNRRAQEIAESTGDLVEPPEGGRFAVALDEGEFVYEAHGFAIAPTAGGEPRRMNLYVDRTQAVVGERQLLMAERLASLGRVAQGVAHELNTPLATIRTLATDLRGVVAGLDGLEMETANDLSESIELIRDETARLGRITQNLLARGDLAGGHRSGAVGLLALVQRAQAVVFAGAKRGGPSLVLDPALDTALATAEIDPLIQILVNLLQNGADALRNHPEPCIRVGVREEGEMLALFVEDNGAGVAPEVEPRLFEPFATTKPPGEGTGLGLYTSYMLAQRLGGELSYQAGPDGGATFVLLLPRALDCAEALANAGEIPQRSSS